MAASYRRVLWATLMAATALASVLPIRSAAYAGGIALQTRGNDSAAFRLFQLSALLGYPHGLSTLGAMYLEGRAVSADPRRAAYWLERAAAYGDAQAQGMLGLLYLSGIGTAPDRDKARHWLSRAAIGGDLESARMLSLHFPASRQ